MAESEYVQNMPKDDQDRYKAKLTLTDGTRLTDPFTLSTGWDDDISKLPNITWRDVTEYLIDTPSVYTKESMKAYKSLDAFNYFLCGHVHNCLYNAIDNNHVFCFIKSQVLPSQRQSKTSALYKVWVCLNKQHGWVLTANCTCMAGLGSACSHVAALLFKLEAAVHAGLNDQTAPTSELCAWKACKSSVTPAPLKAINFTKPKKRVFPSVGVDSGNDAQFPKHYSYSELNTSAHGLSVENIQALYRVCPNAALFTSISVSNLNQDNSRPGSETDSDMENDDTTVPEPLTSIFDATSINMDDGQLATHAIRLYKLYCGTYSQSAYNNLCKVTEKQCTSKAWMIHRAGRVTASTCHQVYNMRDTIPSQSTIATIMQYSEPLENKYVRYGRQMEDTAKKCFITMLRISHKDAKVTDTGFHVKAAIPYLGASPDGLVTCSCHADAVLEIKCPYKYQTGLIGWETDTSFALYCDLTMKENHRYYFQLQLQMLLCNVNVGYFFVYAPSETHSSLLSTVTRNDALLNHMQTRLFNVFEKVLLPEIVSRRRDCNIDNDRKVYCSCRRPAFGQMIGCDDPKCAIEWYHYPCVHITRAPRGKWFCEACRHRS